MFQAARHTLRRAATRAAFTNATAFPRAALAAGERGLSQVLGEELEHERTTYKPSEVVAKGPPEPFEMIETDGDCEITLVRAFGDDEEIAVTFNATEDPYEEDEYFASEVDGAAGEGDEGLEFSCATDGETVEVRNVRYESLGGGASG